MIRANEDSCCEATAQDCESAADEIELTPGDEARACGEPSFEPETGDGADDEAGVESESATEREFELEDNAEEELFEVEVDEDDIYAYIVDEDDNEIGFVLLDENGEEQEYYYVDDECEYTEVEETSRSGGSSRDKVASKCASSDDEFDFGITREGVADATADMNAIYKDGVAVATELKSAFDDINESLSFLKKK